MEKPWKIVLATVGGIALIVALSSTSGIFQVRQVYEVAQAALPTPPEPSEPSTPSPTPQPTPSPSPEPTPVPTPEPLGIEKQALPFAELSPTTAMTFDELIGDNGVYENIKEIPPLPSSDTYRITVNEYWQFVTVYKRNANGEYTIPVRYMIASTGSYKTPTIKGTFTMGSKNVRFGLFSVGVYGQYWRQITRAFYFHSLLYLKKNVNTYNESYSMLGKRASHGCVRLTVPDARWIYYNIAPGTVCEIIRGDKNDTEAAAIKAQLVLPKKPKKRPSLVKGMIPVTEAWPGWQGNAYNAYQEYLASLPQQQKTK